MHHIKNISLLFIFLFTINIYGQDPPKELQAVRVTQAPKIDGKLDDLVWQNAPVARDFVMFRPGNGDPEPEDQKTEVKVIYNNSGIYIGARMYDPEPDKILRQLTERDNMGTTDFFGIGINPNNDGQNEFEFFVTAAGVQLDAQVSPSNGEDFSWSEVWFSKISYDDKGWNVEIKIPYSALRFSNEKNQIWGINFHRRIERKREQYTWNFVDKTKGQLSQYAGILTGISDITPPTRLSFSPFSSVLIGNYDGVTDTDFAIGMDVKYGITDNFTLITTLIPDFSQVGFDNVTLNLGPFEQRFDEQRQFFIEGADLLNKGNLFFSRRIGNRPVGYGDAEESLKVNEEAYDNPTQVDVLNATKVTGRSKKGLGIAVLNAVTKETKAKIRDTITGTERSMVTEPLTNYNVFVIDQEFNKNSSVGFANTSVIRSGHFRDANVSSLIFNLANKDNSYKIRGDGSTSTVKEDALSKTGFATNLMFSKTKGNVRYNLVHEFADSDYNKNDLGFQRQNNYNNFKANVNYRIFTPTKHFNNLRIGIFAGYFRRFDPSVFTNSYVELDGFVQTKKEIAYGFEIGSNLTKKRDYFEPRTEGRYWLKDPETQTQAWISTDYRKKLAIDARIGIEWANGNNAFEHKYRLSPRFRANDKLLFNYSIAIEKKFNNLGYVDTLEDETIVFGKRDLKEIENSMGVKYSINALSSVSLAFRHYWSPVTYQETYYQLEEDGTLTELEQDYTADNDLNFNSWNLDLRYVWEFTRGSELVALYRNSILNYGSENEQSFQDNISNLFDQPLGQSFSIKVIYFLDYNKVKSWL